MRGFFDVLSQCLRGSKLSDIIEISSIPANVLRRGVLTKKRDVLVRFIFPACFISFLMPGKWGVIFIVSSFISVPLVFWHLIFLFYVSPRRAGFFTAFIFLVSVICYFGVMEGLGGYSEPTFFFIFSPGLFALFAGDAFDYIFKIKSISYAILFAIVFAINYSFYIFVINAWSFVFRFARYLYTTVLSRD